jgi:hypothetical protein
MIGAAQVRTAGFRGIAAFTALLAAALAPAQLAFAAEEMAAPAIELSGAQPMDPELAAFVAEHFEAVSRMQETASVTHRRRPSLILVESSPVRDAGSSSVPNARAAR